MNYPKNLDSALKWNYKFWNTQPTTKLKEIVSLDGPVNKENNQSSQQEPYKLPDDFQWVNLNMSNETDRNNLSEFLDKCYVEDKEKMFRLHYSPDFINWMYKDTNHIGVGITVKKNNLLVATICGKIVKMQVNKNKLDMVEVNFLCVHPKLRNKRLSPILIKELTRQFNLKGFYYATFTDSNYLPTPIYSSQYYHRAINLNTLLDTGFTTLDKNTNLSNVKKTLKLPDTFLINKFVKLDPIHLDQCYDLYNKYMDKYNYHHIFTKNEFSNLFLDNKFVHCYVVLDDDDNVLDFISYYIMNSRVISKNTNHEFIRRGVLFYYTCTHETCYRLVRDILIAARNNNIDVFDALDIMENQYILKELKFEEGTGTVNYYLYNWKIKPLKSQQIATILM
ncbi:myristoyl-CoA:protein N-myristoyltransferase [Fadolivirus algeromassiliense]|jgi:glycylpeptide N-tetradecanoyltransferase|uniref:glycylpeptide N-tetradecanoyltransferase n=1 Tax=Fadolivirus FV1/VV64 TaxID=3070911 RepID=A0A7D3R1D7_9VIRU|nr:myristoyl-CoA:protein N-myristoyltransferase [Fadolivirus algeromassiliense]QKF93738.1 myristoyl-CoA:protein N-myristoyltransferase [Fadolivirus FV1/VV64]